MLRTAQRRQLVLRADLVTKLEQVALIDLIDRNIHHDLGTVFIERTDELGHQPNILLGIADRHAVGRLVRKNNGLSTARLRRNGGLHDLGNVFWRRIREIKCSQNELLKLLPLLLRRNDDRPRADLLKEKTFLQKDVIEGTCGRYILELNFGLRVQAERFLVEQNIQIKILGKLFNDELKINARRERYVAKLFEPLRQYIRCCSWRSVTGRDELYFVSRTFGSRIGSF